MTNQEFGQRVTEIAADWWKRGAREGTPEGDAIISELLGTTTWPRDAYCGLTVQAWYAAASLKRNLASVGKVLFGFGYGNRTAPGGKVKAFTEYQDAGLEHQKGRIVTRDLTLAQPGDIVLHQAKPGAFTGHVMMCLDCDGKRLSTIEGNGTGVLYLPGLPVAQGICVRRWSLSDPKAVAYLNWVIRPAAAEVEGIA